MRDFYRLLFLAAAILLVVLLQRFNPAPLGKILLPLEDHKFHLRESLGLTPIPPAELVIVTVDEKSVNSLGRWPWDRKAIGTLIRQLDGARLVGLDMVFSEPTDPLQDQALARAIESAGNVILGFFFRSVASVATTEEDLDSIADCAYRQVLLRDPIIGLQDFPFAEVNLPPFATAALGCASFNNVPDMDGIFRRYPLVHLHQGYPFPPLAVQLQRYALNQEANLVLDRSGVAEFHLGGASLKDNSYLRLNFYQLRQESFIPAIEVIDGTIPAEFFHDKIVLVGVTEIGVYDMRPTPVQAITPGVWLHFTALGNLLQERLLRDAPGLDLLLAICLLLLLTGVSYRPSLWVRALFYVLVLLAFIGVANYLFIFHDLWLREGQSLLPAVLLVLSMEGFAFMRTEVRAGVLKRAFASYVSPEVVREIINHPERLGLGGVEREVTALFSDIRDFTPLSEQLAPAQLVRMLSAIHDPLTRIILRQRGMLDKYIGDAMMALFNAPVDLGDHPDRAVTAALEMLGALREINERFRQEGLPPVDIGIGINTGTCIVGNMGSEVRFEYTAIGDSINLASRLEGLCKIYGCRILISEFTRQRLVGDFLLRTLDRVRVRGKSVPVEIYEVMEDSPANRALQSAFEGALERYLAGDYTAAADFSRLAQKHDDRAALLFAERCHLLQLNPPAPGWDGVRPMAGK